MHQATLLTPMLLDNPATAKAPVVQSTNPKSLLDCTHGHASFSHVQTHQEVFKLRPVNTRIHKPHNQTQEKPIVGLDSYFLIDLSNANYTIHQTQEKSNKHIREEFLLFLVFDRSIVLRLAHKCSQE